VSIAEQNRAEYQHLLEQALVIDVDTRPEWRLANLVMQRRAHWLLAHTDDLFLE
jgi:predicted anti-sigma-YlaC factor YlaD